MPIQRISSKGFECLQAPNHCVLEAVAQQNEDCFRAPALGISTWRRRRPPPVLVVIVLELVLAATKLELDEWLQQLVGSIARFKHSRKLTIVLPRPISDT